MKQIYFLGEGCYQYSHSLKFDYLKDKISQHQIFKGSSCYKPFPNSYFPPLALFDGTLKKEFLDGNFIPVIEHIEAPFKNIIKNIDVRLKNPKTSFQYCHILVSDTQQLFNKDRMLNRFKYFEENINNFIYIIDFSRQPYRSFGNKWILKFENFLIQNKIDLNLFYYLCPEDKCSNIFDNAKIELIKIPTQSLYICGSKLPCCSCYFYKNYKNILLDKILD